MASSRQSTQSLPLYSGWSRIQPMSFAATSLAGSCIMHRSTRLAFRQKFDVSKDLLLARFGSSLAVRQEFGRGNLTGHDREGRKQAGDNGSPADDLASDNEGLGTHLTDELAPLRAPTQASQSIKNGLKTTAPPTWSRYCCGTCRDRSRPARQAATTRRKRACRRSWRRSPWRSGRAAYSR